MIIRNAARKPSHGNMSGLFILFNPKDRDIIYLRPMAKRSQNPIFVIQKHKATHLHYDFRLEKDGILKSWAIPKEPPKEAGVRRLAIQVEDHALGYENFEGEIPEGSYGAGQVEVWDKGHYSPVKLQSNEIIFELKGRKLKGVYCLIKLKPKLPKDKNWLFFKKKI